MKENKKTEYSRQRACLCKDYAKIVQREHGCAECGFGGLHTVCCSCALRTRKAGMYGCINEKIVMALPLMPVGWKDAGMV